MTHVSILVPRGSAVVESVVSVFTILDRANGHAMAAGSDTVFDLHLVGTTSCVELYGGQTSVRPDLGLKQNHSTDLVIVPALAGDLAESVERDAACIPWLQEQYRSGAEVAGLCTGALFIADSGLIGDEHCSAHWFVDAMFRHEFSHVNFMVDRTAPPEGAIISTGAYAFFHCLLERAGGHALASMCSASFETVFNRQCQSVLSLSDSRILGLRNVPQPHPAFASTAQPGLTAARFASMFEPGIRRRRGSLVLESRGRRPATGANSTTLKRLFKRVLAQRDAHRGRTAASGQSPER